jgi:hypothetical protein
MLREFYSVVKKILQKGFQICGAMTRILRITIYDEEGEVEFLDA